MESDLSRRGILNMIQEWSSHGVDRVRTHISHAGSSLHKSASNFTRWSLIDPMPVEHLRVGQILICSQQVQVGRLP